MGKRGVLRSRCVLVAVALASVALLVPTTSPAVYSGCGGQHGGSASCNFTPIGIGFSLYGGTSLSDPAFVSVRVKDALGRTIASCSGIAFCDATYQPVAVPGLAEVPVPLGPLVCEVFSFGAGFYSCTSYVA